MRSDLEIKKDRLKQALKQLLKRQSKTYSDLADFLGCSLPTAKRLMNKEDIGLDRLLAICDWLGVNLAQLEEIASEVKEGEVSFTREQEDFFYENPHFFSYFIRLCNQQTPQQIAKERSLMPLSTEKYLLGLERLGLVRRTTRGQVKVVPEQLPGFRLKGKLVKAHYSKLLRYGYEYMHEVMTENIFAQKSDFVGWFALSRFHLTSESIDRYSAKLSSLLEELRHLDRHEGRVHDAKELRAFTVEAGFTHLKEGIEPTRDPYETDIFGSIKPLD